MEKIGKADAPVNPSASAGMTQENQGTWDSSTQTFHGGQDWAHLSNFVEDFSVTTNGLGTPEAALQAAYKAVSGIKHYPPSDFEPAASDLARFLWPGETWTQGRERLLLGNGASELIDLVIRNAIPGQWRPGPQRTQYKEYARSALAAGFTTAASTDRSATLMCLVNPTNPTGDYWGVEEMKAFIEGGCDSGTTVIVDESMQPWLGPKWREDSLYSQAEWLRSMSVDKGVHVWVMTSWTKIWSCCGVRLGSVVAPTTELQKAVKAKQVPWSVNSIALHFLSEAIRDTAYLKRTWDLTQVWNRDTRKEILEQHPDWEVHGKDFLSWLWINTHDEAVTADVVRLARAAGVPVRSGAPGYNLPTFFRIAVRKEAQRAALWKALLPLAPSS
ncbi:unnamed protein product [Ectocarpus sp. 6 AP-2014]